MAAHPLRRSRCDALGRRRLRLSGLLQHSQAYSLVGLINVTAKDQSTSRILALLSDLGPGVQLRLSAFPTLDTDPAVDLHVGIYEPGLGRETGGPATCYPCGRLSNRRLWWILLTGRSRDDERGGPRNGKTHISQHREASPWWCLATEI